MKKKISCTNRQRPYKKIKRQKEERRKKDQRANADNSQEKCISRALSE